MAIETIDAYSFQLRGGGATITYNVRSHELHYHGPTRPSTDDVVEITETVAPLDVPIGRLVTATLGLVADAETNTVSVLLPEVNLPLADDLRAGDVTFETVAVFTASRSTIGGPGLVEGAVQLYEHATMEGVARAPCVFTATLSRRPPGPGVLRVEGACTFATTGFEVSLLRHEPQGFNPRDLLLDLVVEPPDPDDFVGQAFTTVPVSYQETTEADLDTVTILPDGVSIEVRLFT